MQDTLARKLRVLRAERRLTLRQAERVTGVDKDTLSKLERGLRHPYDITLSRLARGYGVPVDELLEEPGPLVEAQTGPGQQSYYRVDPDAARSVLEILHRQHIRTNASEDSIFSQCLGASVELVEEEQHEEARIFALLAYAAVEDLLTEEMKQAARETLRRKLTEADEIARVE
jgi:transcriptional regulator with XRE-family HTH domain